MRTEDVRRLRKATTDPDTWRNAPTTDSETKSVLGPALCKEDEALRLQQEEALRPVRPVISALDWLARVAVDVPATAVNTVFSLQSCRQALSDAVHTVAYSVTEIQKQRDQLLLNTRAGGVVAPDERLDGANWAKNYSSLLGEADALRRMRKDLGTLGKNGRGPRTPRGAPADGAKKSNRQRKRDDWVAKRDKRKGAQKGAQKTPEQQSAYDKKKYAEKKKPDAAEKAPS